MINLLNLNYPMLRDFCTEHGEKPFRAQQLMQWIHQRGLANFADMHNLSHAFMKKLSEVAQITLPEIVSCHQSSDGTKKWLMKLACGNCIETVYIPEPKRGTLCISSQVGCGLNCSFCSTAKQGFNRDLTTAEIIGQVWIAARENHITNIVLMGMGEPLLNFDNVVVALDIMLDDYAYGLSKRRVTLSTSGVIPEMLKLRERSPVALAVSLHAPTDELRNLLVPLNKKYPLKRLMQTCEDYFPKDSRRRVTFEYVMLKNINDQPEHVDALIKLVRHVPCKINLIPFNPFPFTPYQRSDDQVIDAFRDRLMAKGIQTNTRRTRGQDVDGACGQLAGKVNDRTKRAERWQKLQFTANAAS